MSSHTESPSPPEAPARPGPREQRHGTTSFQTLIHLLKGNIGPGILNFPECFKYAGIYFGLVGTTLLGMICLHCSQLLLEASSTLCRKHGFSSLSYEMTAYTAMANSPYKRVRQHAKLGRLVVESFLAFTQLGVCCVLLVFIAENLEQVVTCLVTDTNLTHFHLLLMVLPAVIVFTYIHNLKTLAPVSMVASAAIFSGLVITFYYCVSKLATEPVVKLPAFGGVANLPSFFSGAIYAFEGIGLVLPLENRMQQPAQFHGPLGVLNTGFWMVIIMFNAVGYFGYQAYGDQVAGSITLNLPASEIPALVVKILVSGSMLLTYPIQFYVARDIVEPGVLRRCCGAWEPSGGRRKGWGGTAAAWGFRTIIVLITFTLAATIPNLGLFINLIGSLCSSTLAIIFPALIHLASIGEAGGRWVRVKAGLLVVFGVVGFVAGSITSVSAIVEFFRLGRPDEVFTC